MSKYNKHHYKHHGEMMSILASHCFLCEVNELEKERDALRALAERAIGFLSVNGIYSEDLQQELNKIKGGK